MSIARIGYWLVVLILVLLPLERWILPYNIKLVDIGLIMLTMYGITGICWKNQTIILPLIMPMWLIMIASLISTLFGFRHLNSIVAILQEVYLYGLLIVMSNVLKEFSLSEFENLMKIWSAVAVLEAGTCLMGMLEIGPKMFYVSPVSGEIRTLADIPRAVGTFVNPNATAGYLSISVFVLLATSWSIWLRLIFEIWLLAGMYATGSMGALVSTFISLVVLVMIYFAPKMRQVAVSWIFVISINVILLSIIFIVLSNWHSILDGTESIENNRILSITIGRLPQSLASRYTLIERGWTNYRDYPFGTGPNTSILITGSLHNDYVAFLFERGPIGAIGWLWLVGATLLAPLWTAKVQKDDSRRWKLLCLGAGFLASGVNAGSHEISHFRQVWILMAFIFAMRYVLSVRSMVNQKSLINFI